MKQRRTKWRKSFQVKVLVPVIAVMALLMGVTMWVVNERISAQLQNEAAQQLETDNRIFVMSQETRLTNMLLRYRPIMGDRRYLAFIETTDDGTLSLTMNEFLKGQIKASGAIVTACLLDEKNPRIYAHANTNQEFDTDDFLARCSTAIRQAAKEGEPAMDTINVGSKVLDVICLPLFATNKDQTGVMIFGVEIGAKEISDIKHRTGSEVLFVADGQIAVASFDHPEYYPKLAERFAELRSGRAIQKSNWTAEAPAGKKYFMCLAGQIKSLERDSGLGYLLLCEQPVTMLRSTQQMLFLLGLLGIVLSTSVVWLLIGRVTEPLRQLRDSAEAVGQGDFSKRVEVTSQDECGELAVVFNRMTENIKASREQLEKTVDTLKSTQNQLIQSEKLSGIGEFVAGVAHELNNPLTSVMGFAELLQQSDMPEQQRKYLDVIFKSAKRCQKIVASLLSFARRHAPERKVINLNEIVDSAVEILQYQMRTSNIEVVTQLDPNLPATEADPHQIQQVFLNIINNARQAMEGQSRKGRLRVSTKASEGMVRVIFEDSGPGIPTENLKKIFNPFFTTKEVGKGTGLGLSLCYGIVTEHGGTITPYSKEGQGATFVLELPITLQVVKAAEKKATSPIPTGITREGVGKRVLVVDDEESILQMISEVLTRNGYRVDVARDGESALRLLAHYHYDLALCDWKMPGLSGQQVYERLYAKDPEMSQRLIFITGDIVNEKTQEFLQERNKVCLSKPFTLVEFRTAINRVMTARAA
jgi:signal transduction histidine kinase